MGKTRISTPKKSGYGKSTASNGSPKVPKPSELTDAKVGGSKTKNDQEKDDSIHIYVLPYCDDASVYGADFEEGAMKALHLEHAYPNIWFLILRNLNAYCESKRTTDTNYPKTWQELCSALKMKIATTSPANGTSKLTDEDDIGTFVKNRVAIYCNQKEVKNICCFLDGFVAWRVVTKLSETEPEFDQTPKMTIHTFEEDPELSFGSDEELECEIDVRTDMNTKDVSVVQAYPPTWPPRFVIATISSESESTISMVFSGNTVPFAEGFDSLNIGKKGVKKEGSQYNEWYRVARAIDLSSEDKRKWALSIFGNGVLKGSPCFIQVDSFPKHDEDWKLFFDEVKQYRNVHVRA